MNDKTVKRTVSNEKPSSIAQVHISVRGLVEFVLRHGDIDNRRKGSQGPDVMLEGANIHRMIQRKMGTTYHPEYYLRSVVRRPEYDIVIDGRADGVVIPPVWEKYINEMSEYDESPDNEIFGESDVMRIEDMDNISNMVMADAPTEKIIIDEIKTTYRDLAHIKEPEPVHLAQAKCYAYMFCVANRIPSIRVRMTYVNTESHETRYFDSDYSFTEIVSWYREIMKLYVRWADFEVNWKRNRNASIEGISFPYEYRSGQRELVAQVFKSIEEKEHLFVMAPTGVGKTLANVYPSLKAMALGRAEKIFYLTAKTITRTVAADCLNLLRQQHMRLKSVTLTAKEKICPMDECECNPVKCPYAKGHYDRINDAMYDFLENEDEFSRELVMKYADRHMVCPFEFSLDMSLFSDVIICDYNYAFDPNVYLRRFFGEGTRGSYLFLVDEAHNLVERAMSMYSAELVKERFLDMKHMVKEVDSRLARTLESCNKMLLAYKRECEDVQVVEDFEPLIPSLLRLSAKIEQFMDDNDHYEHATELLDFYFEIRHFLNIYENMHADDYVCYTKINDNGDFEVRLMCANPANWIKQCTSKARFTVFFSATLIPINYYRMMLGAKESDPAVYAQSVFDPGRRALLVARDVTSKYTRRNDAEYDRMAEYISRICKSKSGNYMVFFPSFAMLERVKELYMTRYYDESTEEVIAQEIMMSEKMREQFIAKFMGNVTEDEAEEYDEVFSGEDANADIFGLINMEVSISDDIAEFDSDELLQNNLITETSAETLIGFCVLGGIFSEGIDLKNDALIGAIIIGTGLPMVCAERELLKRRYDESGLDGFAYAYRYPGMNKALQAAGRVIRTADDTGVVALLDERYLGRDYMSLFPREWNNYKICRVDDINESLEDFWKNHPL